MTTFNFFCCATLEKDEKNSEEYYELQEKKEDPKLNLAEKEKTDKLKAKCNKLIEESKKQLNQLNDLYPEDKAGGFGHRSFKKSIDDTGKEDSIFKLIEKLEGFHRQCLSSTHKDHHEFMFFVTCKKALGEIENLNKILCVTEVLSEAVMKEIKKLSKNVAAHEVKNKIFQFGFEFIEGQLKKLNTSIELLLKINKDHLPGNDSVFNAFQIKLK